MNLVVWPVYKVAFFFLLKRLLYFLTSSEIYLAVTGNLPQAEDARFPGHFITGRRFPTEDTRVGR